MHTLRHLLALLLFSVGLALGLTGCSALLISSIARSLPSESLSDIPPNISRTQLMEYLSSHQLRPTGSEFITEPDGSVIETLIFRYHKKQGNYYIGYDEVLLILKKMVAQPVA